MLKLIFKELIHRKFNFLMGLLGMVTIVSLVVSFYTITEATKKETIQLTREAEKVKWWNPKDSDIHVIEGQAWSENLETPFDRLPIDAKEKVRNSVWSLSKNTAGLSIRFRSNASNIVVKYKLQGAISMPHMPATGVSGLDLYAKNSDGAWVWVKGNYSIGKSAIYNFVNLKPNDQYHNKGREYQLYLPLYNSIDSLEIGVSKEALFIPHKKRIEKPIVVYGTSITQGACASRPGMAWTAILERKMDRPLINLGFSGNGRLEAELIHRMTSIDAKIYMLDCLPNLSVIEGRSLENVKQLVLNAVRTLRTEKPAIPILLVEHIGYSDELIHKDRKRKVADLNKTMKEAFGMLLSEGVSNLHLLTKEAINLNLDSTVDGIHPNDLGMQHYANAYEKALRSILDEPIGKYSTTIPVTQSREWHFYKWEERHRELLELNKKSAPRVSFFGNSIVHFWGGEPKGPVSNGPNSWSTYMSDLGIRNFSYGWDRVENALWRVYHGELDGFDAEHVVAMLGTNNFHLNSDKEIIEGIKLFVEAVKNRQPKAKVLLLGILPRRDNEERVLNLNFKIAQLAGTLQVGYTDAGAGLLHSDGKINEDLFKDGLHPNDAGYGRIAPYIIQYIK